MELTMLKSILAKTLYEKRSSTLIWTIAFLATVVLIVVLFPTFKDSFGEALKDVPESLQGLLGNASDYQTINGFIDIQVIGQMVFLTLILGIIIGTSLLAGEENSRTLHTLLAQPVSRTRIYIEKYMAIILITALACIGGIFGGIVLGVLPIGELSNVDIGRSLQAAFMTWLLTLAFATLAYSIGAITGKRGVAGIVAGFFAFATYMITTLASSASALEKLNTISPFHYFNQPSVMKTGLDTGNIAVLGIATLALFLVGLYIFRRRNIY
jgi:ABC-2 type transport system permease protein